MTEVTVRGGAGLTQEIRARGHSLRADEPLGEGRDAGPTPYELLLAALGACTAMTVRLYADRKGWPLEAVEVALSHRRAHASDCRDCETRDGWLDHVTKRLSFEGPLTHDQRQRLAEIAERCPVRLTLRREIAIDQQVALPGAAGGD